MNDSRKLQTHGLGLMCLALAAILFTACQTTTPPPPPDDAGHKIGELGRLSAGDYVSVTFSGVTSPPEKFEGRVQDDGTISLPLVGAVPAVGKTPVGLQNDILKLYVPRYFNQLNVVVNTESRMFTVQGEVRMPNRFVYSGRTTVLGAIATAGGFTDFAKKSDVKLIRADGKIITVNCKKALKHPADLDIEVYPLDRIWVPRRYY